jgi:DNA excision repair protein ERCC-2
LEGFLNERPSQTAAVGAAVKAATSERDLRILWLTRTAAEVSHVARELSGVGARPFYGRRVLCVLDPVSRVDEKRFPVTCRAVRVAGKCPYWPGRPQRRSSNPVTVAEFKETGKMALTCPYELQLKSIPSASFLVATHRQLQAVGWLLGRWGTEREEVLLVLDEAQNLLLGVLEMVRDEISLTTILRASKEAEKYGFPELSRQLREVAKKYKEVADTAKSEEVEADNLLPDWEELRMAGEEVQERKLRAGFVPASWILRVADFVASLARERPLLVREEKKITLLALQDPVEALKRALEGWSKIVLMSATIDAEMLESLSGEEIVLLRAGWPADDEWEGPEMTFYIMSGFTTRFEARDEVMIERVQRLLTEVVEKARSHGWGVLVYFPSYELLEWTKETMTAGTVDDPVLWEVKGASQEEVDSLIREFTSRQGGRVLCAVAGGRLSEGVDLPADLVIVLGVPFSPPTPRQERLIKRLSEVVGNREKAWRYAMALPAVWKTIQATGRAVRKPDDSAVVLLVDDRYQHLHPLFPR